MAANMSSATPSSDEGLFMIDARAPGVIPVLPQRNHLCNAEEDWSGVTAQAKRRRLQNRINQRARRHKLKEETKKQAVAQRQSLDSDVQEIPRDAVRTLRKKLPAQACMLGKVENREMLTRFAELARNDFLGAPNMIHLEDTVRCNVFLAMARVTRILGFDDSWLDDDSISPYTMRGPRTWSLDAMPANLRPTVLQLAVEHHPWIDLFPCPRMRDNFLRTIQVHGEYSVDEDELCRDYVDAAGAKRGLEDGASAIVWSDPWSPYGWELTAGFVKKWAWLLHGCVELQAGTNAWRTRRGLERLRFPGC